jgi:hypothetical protein
MCLEFGQKKRLHDGCEFSDFDFLAEKKRGGV